MGCKKSIASNEKQDLVKLLIEENRILEIVKMKRDHRIKKYCKHYFFFSLLVNLIKGPSATQYRGLLSEVVVKEG